MASDLNKWVEEQLMQLMGYSKALVAHYVIRLAKDASSPTDLTAKLLDYGFSSSDDLRSFATRLYHKVPHKQSTLTAYQKDEREAAKLVRKQMTYKLLEADDEDADEPPTPNSNSNKDKLSSSSSKKRFRKKSKAEGSRDDEA